MSFVTPPQSFLDFPGKPDIPWPRWKLVFLNYMEASGATECRPERKKAIFLHCLGMEGQRIYYALPEPTVTVKKTEGNADDTDVYLDAIQKVEAHFKPVNNVLTSRIKFGNRIQLPGETVDNYLLALRQLAVACEFNPAAEQEMIRDLFVKNCNITKFQESIMNQKDISLNNVVAIAKRLEQSVQDLKLLTGNQKFSTCSSESVHESVNYTQPGSSGLKRLSKPRSKPTSNFHKAEGPNKYRQGHARRPNQGKVKYCYRCGSANHLANSEQCKARNAICNNCSSRGHWSKVCFKQTPRPTSNQVQYINEQEENLSEVEQEEIQNESQVDDDTYDSVSSCQVFVCNLSSPRQGLSVYGNVDINKVKFRLLVDTGSPRTLLSEADYDTHFKKYPLLPPKCTLKSYSMSEIQVNGCFMATVKYQDSSCEIPIHVVKRGISLMGMDLVHSLRLKIDCESLQVNNTFEVSAQIPEEFQSYEELFTPGLGCANSFTHKINVDEEIHPVQAKLRRLPFSIRETVSKLVSQT